MLWPYGKTLRYNAAVDRQVLEEHVPRRVLQQRGVDARRGIARRLGKLHQADGLLVL